MTDGAAHDLDATVFVCGEAGKVRSDKGLAFYSNMPAAAGAGLADGPGPLDARRGVNPG